MATQDELYILYEENRKLFEMNAGAFNQYLSSIAGKAGAGLVSIMAYLAGHMDYRSFEAELTISSICTGTNMAKSTVHAHLAKGRASNIIQTDKIKDLETGHTGALRFSFPEFLGSDDFKNTISS